MGFLFVKQGSFTSRREILPILSFKNCLVAKCIGTRNNLDYETLTAKDFASSLGNIKNVAELKKDILRRYRHSLPKLTPKKIISMGVAITKLKILGTWEKWKK